MPINRTEIDRNAIGALLQLIDGKPVPAVDMQSDSRILIDGFRHREAARLIVPNPRRKDMAGDKTSIPDSIEEQSHQGMFQGIGIVGVLEDVAALRKEPYKLWAQKLDNADAPMRFWRPIGPKFGILFLGRKPPFGNRNTRTGHIGRST